MAKIVQSKVWWDPVTVEDLGGYRVYYAPVGVPFGYDLPSIFVPKDVVEVNAPQDFPDGAFPEEAEYNVWITAVDEVGNESDPLALSARFDFIPPPAPLSGGITYF